MNKAGRAIQRENPTYKIETISRVYAYVNQEYGPEWYEYETWNIPQTFQLSDFEIGPWIDGGKYSDVFIGYKEKKTYAFKILKPVGQQKYKREAKILRNLKDGPNIVHLEGIILNPSNNQYTFVFERVFNTDYRQLFASFTDQECRFYFYQILLALEYSHSHGIMHRDIKPQNIMYDREHQKIRLIDWGLADFYHPRKRYNIHVGSRNYKPIELLVDYQLYDYSVDIWAFGVTMAGIIFHSDTAEPFFNGKDDFDMAKKICEFLGRQDLDIYLQKYGIDLPPELERRLGNDKKKSLAQIAKKTKKKDLISNEAIDLIEKCLKYDHMERISAREALQHPYFFPVLDRVYD